MINVYIDDTATGAVFFLGEFPDENQARWACEEFEAAETDPVYATRIESPFAPSLTDEDIEQALIEFASDFDRVEDFR